MFPSRVEDTAMLNITLNMPAVADCEVSNCVYNMNSACHARAITVGDSFGAMCDTFLDSNPHTKATYEAGVGACKMADCRHNTDYECQADSISVVSINQMARCGTFEP